MSMYNHFNTENGLPMLKYVHMEWDRQKVKLVKNKSEAKDTGCLLGEQPDLLRTAQLFGFPLLFVVPRFTHLTYLQTAGNSYGREPGCFSEVSVLGNKTHKNQ